MPDPRPPTRPSPASPATQIWPQLLRLAVLPPVAVALSACAAVLFIIRSTGARPGAALWGVLGGAVSVTLAGIVIAAVAADRAARSVHDRLEGLRRSTARHEADLCALVDTLRRGDGPPPRAQPGRTPGDADEFDRLGADLSRAHDSAVTAVVQASRLSSQAGSEQKLEVFVNLARRLQSLVHREISILDEMENEIEDPDLLKGLFHVDHLATRIRRHAENLAVLGGAVSRRQWSHPVSMTEVLRSAIAEVEQYSRVKLVPPIDGTLRGYAVADVIHLLAELVENATLYSAPHTQVLLRAGLVTSGLAVEVEDRGLGMPVGEQDRMNALLADPDQVNVASLLADGRIGLYVVSQLARRHGIQVRLQNNIYGGAQAVLVVPQALLGAEQWSAGQGAGASRPTRGDAAPDAEHGGGPAHRPAHAVPAPGSVPPTGPAGHGNGRRPTGPQTGTDPYADGTGPQTGPDARAVPDARTGLVRQAGSGLPPGSGSGTPPTSLPFPAVPSVRHHDQATAPAPTAPEGVAPPLPLRGARAVRPNPAEAVPGVAPDDRQTLEESGIGNAPLTPRSTTVRGTMDRPQLPRRRAQEHLVPQLRDGPTPRQDTEHVVGHDPHLMAAFRRGVSLAETQQSMETGRMGNEDVGRGDLRSDDTADDHMAGDHMASPPRLPSSPMGECSGPTAHPGDAHPVDTRYVDARLMDPHHSITAHATESPTAETHPADARPTHAAAQEARDARDSVPAPRTDHPTARHDGSATAG
ncbi:ATP-binding protein [Streptomyces sp. KMM 9044]|uniref:ATP-binding protein n=1 Tax=Streptomyces sp. KMM 9044 TaxID=2744474 RepID=UPI0021506EE8|nr:ATP-binding protein [Streptomyces sp. KMM 9044]WAX76747.1 ATP-binding protein [Streptomyces sp. KMM 9044]